MLPRVCKPLPRELGRSDYCCGPQDPTWIWTEESAGHDGRYPLISGVDAPVHALGHLFGLEDRKDGE